MRVAIAVGLVAVVGALVVAPPAKATGGVYNVVKCHPWHIEADEFESAGGHPSYAFENDCHGASPDPKIGLFNTGAAGNNAYRQLMLSAPAGTHIETACLDYKLRRDGHHRAEILAFPGFAVLASGGDGPDGWVGRCFDISSSQLIVRLACNEPGGCPSGPNAHAWVRNLTIALADDHDPSITAFGGDLLSPGWIRGTKTLIADAADLGSGVYQLVGYVNGVEVGRGEPQCGVDPLGWNFSPTVRPCQKDVEDLVAQLNTATSPFQNGANRVLVYAADYGADMATRDATLWVDNAHPQAAFKARISDDPEQIRAGVSDADSGVGEATIYVRAVGKEDWQPLLTRSLDGEARARVDSSSMQPGEYEFSIRVTDNAGNSFETTLRDDGSPMRLNFPLRAGAKLRAGLGEGRSTGQTVPYGVSSSVHGRLTDAAGDPLAGQQVVVIDHFSNGALFPRAERPVVTDEQGRFTVPEPAGPTRTVEVEFPGNAKYLPATEGVGRFAVKGAASFRTSSDVVKEGTSIVFSGRVKHRGARIPVGGKLVEVQYRLKTGRQRTLKEPFRTGPDGSYRLSYRFSKALTADALFHFRVKVRGEGNWPFKGSTSNWRKVIVRAH